MVFHPFFTPFHRKKRFRATAAFPPAKQQNGRAANAARPQLF